MAATWLTSFRWHLHSHSLQSWIPKGNSLISHSTGSYSFCLPQSLCMQCFAFFFKKSLSCGSHPAFLPLSEVPHETLPACFLLKLQPAMPVMLSFINKFSQIIGYKFSIDLYKMCASFFLSYTWFTNINLLQLLASLRCLSLWDIDVSIPEVDLQWAPLPKLLMMMSNSHEEAINEQDGVFTVVCLLLTPFVLASVQIQLCF